MKIIVIDDEQIICDGTVRMLKDVRPEAEILGFTDPFEAVEYIRNDHCDVLFLDIEMPGLNGVELAKQIKIIYPRCNVIFVTAFSHYQNDAWNMRASGYVLKPLTRQRIREELEELRFTGPSMSELYFRTFGSFEVFYQGQPLNFRYRKTKEMLAYLIDRNGAMVSREELLKVLWSEEEIRTSYLKRLRQDLITTLTEAGQEHILIKQWGQLGILRDQVYCDYYQWLSGEPVGINSFHGEYMAQYKWGQATLERILRQGMEEERNS